MSDRFYFLYSFLSEKLGHCRLIQFLHANSIYEEAAEFAGNQGKERVHFSYNILPNPSRIEHDGIKITHVLRIPEGQMESNAMNSTSSSSFPTKTSMEVPRLSSNQPHKCDFAQRHPKDLFSRNEDLILPFLHHPFTIIVSSNVPSFLNREEICMHHAYGFNLIYRIREPYETSSP